MFSLFNPDSLYSRVMNRLADIIWLSILFIICSLPIVTIGTSMCAAYYTAVKSIRRGGGYVSKQFFKSFKQNLLQGIIITVIYVVFGCLIINNIMLVNKNMEEVDILFTGVFAAIGFLLTGVTLICLPILSRFNLTIGKLFKMSITISFKHFLTTLELVFMFAVMIALVWFVPILIVVLPGLMIFVMTYPMERVMKKYMPKVEKGSAEAEIWYNQE